MNIKLLLFGLVLVIMSCHSSNGEGANIPPNIIWIVAEDLSPILPPYGDSTIITPNISRLAKEGITYDRVFSPSGVCAPSRAALALGMYPTRIGANHMRNGPWFDHDVSQESLERFAKTLPEDIPIYEAIPPIGSRMMSEYLRMAGYYCTNNSKQDYQFRAPKTAWDESSPTAHYRNRAEGQAFFSIFNVGVTHESQIWMRGQDTLLVSESLEVPVPPYLPTTDSSLMDVRRLYSNIILLDERVGELMRELEEDKLLDNTIIFFYSDHGGPLPRQKRMLYDSGLKVPLIIRFPKARFAGTRSGDLISFIDFAPTVLSLAHVSPPNQMEGRAFLGPYEVSSKRRFVHAAADRFDESYDRIRAVRSERFKYIRYLRPELPMFLPVVYREKMAIMRELHRLYASGGLNKTQMQWFRTSKPQEELFDLYEDPHELNDLSGEEEMSIILSQMRTELDNWMTEEEDMNALPEMAMIHRMWPEGSQPVTDYPSVDVNEEGKIVIQTTTNGATIGYRAIQNGDTAQAWTIYQAPIETTFDGLEIIAHRIGFLPSQIVSVKR